MTDREHDDREPRRRRNRYTYRDAGVDVDAGNQFIDRIRPLAANTRRPGAEAILGGFGGFFDTRSAGFEDPVLVAATDGVGTKLKIAIESGVHDTVGIDLVAMCVNDLVVQGAEPLFFLDYFATGRLDLERAEAVVRGIAEGCQQAGCALIGGETAEMPGMYAVGDYDLAGFAVGAVERGFTLPRTDIKPGDRLIGLTSSGIHSNGFSLVRRLVADYDLDFAEPAPFDPKRSLAVGLLTPTEIYVTSCLNLHRAGHAKAFAHITGGGITENLPRVLPDGVAASIHIDAWKMNEVFRWIMDASGLSLEEMLGTFNCGIGMIAIVAADKCLDALSRLKELNQPAIEIGELVEREPDSSAVRYLGSLRT